MVGGEHPKLSGTSESVSLAIFEALVSSCGRTGLFVFKGVQWTVHCMGGHPVVASIRENTHS